MKLGIVGHAQEKFTERTEALARDAIREEIRLQAPTHIVSGRSPLGGVDAYAEEIAAEFGLPTEIYPPAINTWNGIGGFRDRNLKIAKASDMVLVVVVQKLPHGYTGMMFKICYHCHGRNPDHVKSGGCWTAWQATARKWAIISNPDVPEGT